MKGKAIGYKHPLIKKIKVLKQGKRNENRELVIEGLSLHEKLLQSDMTIEALIVCETLINSEVKKRIVLDCIKHAKNYYIASEKVMKSICDKDRVELLLSICLKPDLNLEAIKHNFQRIVILDGLETPGNIGTIFRTCDGAGIDAVLVVNEKAKVNQYKTIKSSMGGMFSIPWFYYQTVEECINWLQYNSFNILLADPYGKDKFSDLHKENKIAIVVGNERYGLSKEWESDFNISLPMNGICDSLNVGTAASIFIYNITTLVS